MNRNSSLISFKDLNVVSFSVRFQINFESLVLPSNLIAIENETLSDVVFHRIRFPYVLDKSSFLSTITDNHLR